MTTAKTIIIVASAEGITENKNYISPNITSCELCITKGGEKGWAGKVTGNARIMMTWTSRETFERYMCTCMIQYM